MYSRGKSGNLVYYIRNNEEHPKLNFSRHRTPCVPSPLLSYPTLFPSSSAWANLRWLESGALLWEKLGLGGEGGVKYLSLWEWSHTGQECARSAESSRTIAGARGQAKGGGRDGNGVQNVIYMPQRSQFSWHGCTFWGATDRNAGSWNSGERSSRFVSTCWFWTLRRVIRCTHNHNVIVSLESKVSVFFALLMQWYILIFEVSPEKPGVVQTSELNELIPKNAVTFLRQKSDAFRCWNMIEHFHTVSLGITFMDLPS